MLRALDQREDVADDLAGEYLSGGQGDRDECADSGHELLLRDEEVTSLLISQKLARR